MTCSENLKTRGRGTSMEAAGKWVNGVFGPDGKTIFSIPSTANCILAIDTETRKMEKFGYDLLDGEMCKWAGGVLGPKGTTLYGIPSNSESVVSVQLETRTIRLFGELPFGPLNQGKWSGGVLGADGITIFCVPLNSEAILVINTDKTDRWGDPTLDMFGSFPGKNKWSGGVLGPDGVTLFCIPLCAESVLAINTKDRTTTEFGNLPGRCKWRGGVLGPDNITIYCMPACSDCVLAIDTQNYTVRTFGSGSVRGERDCPGWMWSGGILSPDNLNIYGVPLNSNSILVVEIAAEKYEGFDDDDDVDDLKKIWSSVPKDHALKVYSEARPSSVPPCPVTPNFEHWACRSKPMHLPPL